MSIGRFNNLEFADAQQRLVRFSKVPLNKGFHLRPIPASDGASRSHFDACQGPPKCAGKIPE